MDGRMDRLLSWYGTNEQAWRFQGRLGQGGVCLSWVENLLMRSSHSRNIKLRTWHLSSTKGHGMDVLVGAGSAYLGLPGTVPNGQRRDVRRPRSTCRTRQVMQLLKQIKLLQRPRCSTCLSIIFESFLPVCQSKIHKETHIKRHIPVVPARGGAEVALKIYI